MDMQTGGPCSAGAGHNRGLGQQSGCPLLKAVATGSSSTSHSLPSHQRGMEGPYGVCRDTARLGSLVSGRSTAPGSFPLLPTSRKDRAHSPHPFSLHHFSIPLQPFLASEPSEITVCPAPQGSFSSLLPLFQKSDLHASCWSASSSTPLPTLSSPSSLVCPCNPSWPVPLPHPFLHPVSVL